VEQLLVVADAGAAEVIAGVTTSATARTVVRRMRVVGLMVAPP
jgi:hypothetical protein